ncbi:MAG: SprT-like domain-containing protein [Candidatus Brocadiae bacterium]|nr:SprT-like domain-containing protein [Candidatus Brocadiia bacterium]
MAAPPTLPGEDELAGLLQALAVRYYPGAAIRFRVEWSRRMSRSAGLCYYRRKVIRLSWRYHAVFPAEIENTLRHELIHAAGILGHGPRFVAEARRLGCDVHAHPLPGRPWRYVYACPACDQQVRTRRRVDYSCGKCSRRWDARYRLVLKADLRSAGGELP